MNIPEKNGEYPLEFVEKFKVINISRILSIGQAKLEKQRKTLRVCAYYEKTLEDFKKPLRSFAENHNGNWTFS